MTLRAGAPLLAAALAACATPAPPTSEPVERPAPPPTAGAAPADPMRAESPAPEPAPLKVVLHGAPPTPAPPAPHAPTWPTANADWARSRLRILAVVFAQLPPDETPRLHLRGVVETDDPDVLLADAPSKELPRARLVVEGATDEVVTRAVSVDEHAQQDVAVVADVGPDPRRLRSLDVELRLLRVRSWTTREVRLDGNGSVATVDLGPLHFGLSGAPQWIAIGSHSEAALPFGAYGVVQHAEVRDANGVTLVATAGGGSGGAFATMFGNLGAQFAYPVVVKIRIPADYDVLPVTFRFADIDLSAARR